MEGSIADSVSKGLFGPSETKPWWQREFGYTLNRFLSYPQKRSGAGQMSKRLLAVAAWLALAGGVACVVASDEVLITGEIQPLPTNDARAPVLLNDAAPSSVVPTPAQQAVDLFGDAANPANPPTPASTTQPGFDHSQAILEQRAGGTGMPSGPGRSGMGTSQPPTPSIRTTTRETPVDSASPNAAGTFTVVTSGKRTILLNTTSGESWQLGIDEKGARWQPIAMGGTATQGQQTSFFNLDATTSDLTLSEKQANVSHRVLEDFARSMQEREEAHEQQMKALRAERDHMRGQYDRLIKRLRQRPLVEDEEEEEEVDAQEREPTNRGEDPFGGF